MMVKELEDQSWRLWTLWGLRNRLLHPDDDRQEALQQETECGPYMGDMAPILTTGGTLQPSSWEGCPSDPFPGLRGGFFKEIRG